MHDRSKVRFLSWSSPIFHLMMYELVWIVVFLTEVKRYKTLFISHVILKTQDHLRQAHNYMSVY